MIDRFVLFLMFAAATVSAVPQRLCLLHHDQPAEADLQLTGDSSFLMRTLPSRGETRSHADRFSPHLASDTSGAAAVLLQPAERQFGWLPPGQERELAQRIRPYGLLITQIGLCDNFLAVHPGDLASRLLSRDAEVRNRPLLC